ncbi:MAG: hypothetical protein HQL18_02520 [Candidatus Omnitrophica bacterium]|nr:hypothetical protein [Candidatus Omnitrophota bacterium]
MDLLRIPSFFLEDARVMAEVDRYQENESQRLGYDIGLVRAITGWFQFSARTWIRERSGYPYLRIDLRQSDSVRTDNVIEEDVGSGLLQLALE